jgi:hypothetical protein
MPVSSNHSRHSKHRLNEAKPAENPKPNSPSLLRQVQVLRVSQPHMQIIKNSTKTTMTVHRRKQMKMVLH